MLSLTKKISKNQGKKITLLVSLILISNILEGFGISLVLPVFQKILHQDAGASGIGQYVDRLVSLLGVEPTLINTLILLNLAFALKTVIAIVAKYYSTQIASDYMSSVQINLFSHLMRSKISLFQREKKSKFINGMTTEIARTSNVFVQVANWISSFITALLYLAIALKISTMLAILAGLIGLACVAPLRSVNIKATRFGAKWTQLNEQIQNLIHETLSGIKYIKASGFADDRIQKFKVLAQSFRDNWSMMAFNSNLAALFSHSIGVLVLSVLLYMSVSLSISLPELIVFLLAFVRLLPTLTSLAGIKNDINANLSALDTIEEIARQCVQDEEGLGGDQEVSFQHLIELKNIGFRHAASVPLIENVSWKIPFGKVMAIVGPSGRGKTTLVDLILRLYELQSGDIQIDGVSLDKLSLKNWRQQVSYVSQEAFLFHDTIRNNILVGAPEASEADIIRVCEMAHAHNFIKDLEHGYETIVGDQGSKLSGGQKQRIALARALVKKPRLLILDEATSALDSQTEEFIRQTIHDFKIRREMTVIIIAHRMSTVEEADEIFSLGLNS